LNKNEECRQFAYFTWPDQMLFHFFGAIQKAQVAQIAQIAQIAQCLLFIKHCLLLSCKLISLVISIFPQDSHEAFK
jgi:hypothetical protein